MLLLSLLFCLPFHLFDHFQRDLSHIYIFSIYTTFFLVLLSFFSILFCLLIDYEMITYTFCCLYGKNGNKIANDRYMTNDWWQRLLMESIHGINAALLGAKYSILLISAVGFVVAVIICVEIIYGNNHDELAGRWFLFWTQLDWCARTRGFYSRKVCHIEYYDADKFVLNLRCRKK